jgi:hypothetical protein
MLEKLGSLNTHDWRREKKLRVHIDLKKQYCLKAEIINFLFITIFVAEL